MAQPKITIITCTLNSAKTLRANLESVKSQTYKDFEQLFIDGGSVDETVKIIKGYYEQPRLIISQAKGLYDAFNKGLRYASGQVIGFLHSDDVFFDNNALARIAKAFEDNNIDYYCSKMIIYDGKLRSIFAELGTVPHQQTLRDQLYSTTYFAHPTYYCKQEIIKQVGDFDLAYQVASDIDWLYRLEKVTSNFYFDANPLVKFRGEGGSSASNYFRGLREEFAIRLKNEKPSFALYFIYSYHYLRRLVRFILEKLKLYKLVFYARKLLFKLRIN